MTSFWWNVTLFVGNSTRLSNFAVLGVSTHTCPGQHVKVGLSLLRANVATGQLCGGISHPGSARVAGNGCSPAPEADWAAVPPPGGLRRAAGDGGCDGGSGADVAGWCLFAADPATQHG